MRHFVSLATILVLVTLTGSIHAAPQTAVSLQPTDDAYVDIAYSTTNFDGGALNVALSNNPAPPPAATVTKRVFLKFSLSGVGFSIVQARLSLSALSGTACGGPPDAVNVAVYSVADDSWTETGLNWNNQPAIGSLLATLDEGVLGGSGYYHWTDTGTGSFASWLRSQQAANGGDGTATLALEITGTTATTGALFEDREGTGGSLGCPGGGSLPVLRVADAEGPLAVRLERFAATPTSRGVLLEWVTASEIGSQGFNLYRTAHPDGPWQRLNPALIPSQSPGSSEGHVYMWEDREITQSGTYFYRLEAVGLDSHTSIVGTTSVTLPSAGRLWLPVISR
jgi:hypothetical protein